MHCPVSPIISVCFLIQISWALSCVFTCVVGYNIHINLYGDDFFCKHMRSQEKNTAMYIISNISSLNNIQTVCLRPDNQFVVIELAQCHSLVVMCFASDDMQRRLLRSQSPFVPCSGDSPRLPHPFSPSLTTSTPPEEVDGARQHSVASTAPVSPPGEHHLRPPVSHCNPAGSWEPFSTQMSANKDMHVRERGKREEGGRREKEEEEAVGVFGKQRESRRERLLGRRGRGEGEVEEREGEKGDRRESHTEE